MNNLKSILDDAKASFAVAVKEAEAKQVVLKEGKAIKGGAVSDTQRQKFAEAAADAVAARLRLAVVADVLGKKEA